MRSLLQSIGRRHSSSVTSIPRQSALRIKLHETFTTMVGTFCTSHTITLPFCLSNYNYRLCGARVNAHSFMYFAGSGLREAGLFGVVKRPILELPSVGVLSARAERLADRRTNSPWHLNQASLGHVKREKWRQHDKDFSAARLFAVSRFTPKCPK
jgi:hypothetical protein